ncbi:MAG: hypothetical protein U0869_12730 [Chloroflexota bacterium]
MAKRTRGVGVRNTHRPGGHPPVKPATSSSTRSSMGKAAEPPAAIPGEPLKTSSDIDPVASAVAATAAASATAAVATTSVSAASATTASTRSPSRSTPGRVKVKPDSLLATRAADEYVYVRADLRRITTVAAVLFGVLILLWLLFTIVDPFGLY